MKTLLVFAIITIAGSVAIAVFTLLKYEHLKHRHRLSGAMATAHMGAAMLLIAILPAGLGQSIEGAVVGVVAVGSLGAGAAAFYILALRVWRIDHAPASTLAGPLPLGGNQGRRVWAYDDPRWLTIEKWFAGGCVLLLAYNILAWQGLVGDEPPYRPVQSIIFSIALLLQPLAQLARPKSHRLSYVLLGSSLLAMVLSFVIG